MLQFFRKASLLLVIFLVAAFTEKVSGQLALEHGKGFVACGINGKYSINVTQASSGSYTRYKIDWGDGVTKEYAPSQSAMSHDYTALGNYSLKLYGQLADGTWSNYVEYIVRAETSDIGFNIASEAKGVQCKGMEMVLKLNKLNGNSPSTEYSVNYGDSEKWFTYRQDDLAGKDVLELKHSYTLSSCEGGQAAEGYRITLKMNNACGTKISPNFGPYQIADQLKLEMKLPEKECTGYVVNLDNVTKVSPASCGELEIIKNWTSNGEKVEDGFIEFLTPGTYTIVASATMAGLDCGNDKVSKTIEIIEKVQALAEPERADVCEGKEILLDASFSQGGEKKYNWSVVSGNSSNVQFLPTATSEKVRAVFSRYGDYRIRVHVYNDCSEDDAYVDIHVKKEPEVIKKKEIAPLCPESGDYTGILNMDGSIVGYNWYNNVKNPAWTVDGPAGGWSWVGNSSHAEYPRIKFTKPGTYTLTVKAEGVGCGATDARLQKSWVVTVYDPTLTPGIQVKGGKTDICEGSDVVVFENHTTANQNVAYLWTVKKDNRPAVKGKDYVFVTGNESASEPAIRFDTYGDYTVLARLSVQCNSAEQEFRFHVKKEPVATKTGDLQAICPLGDGNGGILDMSGKVMYEWYNDTGQEVEWSVTPSTGVSWVTGYNQHSLLPKIRFTQKGNYTVKLTLAGVGCAAASQVLSWPLEVYDPVISGDITLDEAMKDVCEGGTVSFTNTIKGVNPVYVWTIERAEGNQAGDYTVLPDRNDANPSITFHHYGTYHIRVNLTAQCADIQRDFTVLVRKDPEIVSFNQLGNECKPARVELRGQVRYEWYNDTRKKLTWTVDKETGWKFEAGSGPDQEYPVFVFTDAGTYRLTVTLEDVGCGGGKLSESREIVILDPAIDKNITIDGVEGKSVTICEQAKVSFSNATNSLIPVEYFWQVTAAKEVQEGTDYVFTRGNASSDKPEIQFNTYGKYTVEVSLTTECNRGNPVTERFEVIVQRDPEVFLQNLESICPGEPLHMTADKVTYLWNDNEGRGVRWTVKDKDGHDATGVTFDPAALYPQLVFTLPGTYQIGVELQHAAVCEGKGLKAEKTLVIHDPAMELLVSPMTKELCQGSTFAFTNVSTAAEPATYKWTVTPAPGVPADSWSWAAGSKDTDKQPSILFSRYGIFKVKVTLTANRGCDTQEQEMTVTVKKDPSVQLRDYADMCPGALQLATADNYNWRDNPREVTWTITSPDGVTMETPVGLTPTVQFTQPGKYEVKAQLTSHGCTGDYLSDVKVFTVYPPDIQIHVDIPAMVEENKSIHIVNNCVGKINAYEWSILPDEGWEFLNSSDTHSPEPEIKFTKYGNYRIKLQIDGECCDSVKYYDIAVKGVPEFKFKQLENICAGATVKMADYLTCDAKGAVVVPRWSISPGTEGVDYEYLNPDKEKALFPEIHFTGKGNYTVVLDADAEYGGHQQFRNTINVLQNTVTARVRDNLRACTKPEALLAVELTNLSDGDSLKYEWDIQPRTGWSYTQGNASVRQPGISITDQGDYTVKLKIGNICGDDQAEFTVHAYTNPVITPIEDIKDVCDREYVFRGTDLVHVETNGDDLKTVQWVITPLDFRFGDGTDANTLQPDITFKGSEDPYQLRLEVTNGCGDVIKEEFTALVDEFRDIEGMQDKELCALVSPVLLTAQPHGGGWTTTPAGMIEKQEDGEYYFNPHVNADGQYEVVYTYGHKSCVSTATLQVTVHQLPVVNAGEDLERCLNLPPLVLQPGSPAGGDWQLAGNRLTEFDPGATGTGDFKLEYWYTDPLTQCPNVDSVIMTVHPLPDAGFKTPAQHCLGVDSLFTPVELGAGNHFEWTFGDGTKEVSEDAPLSHHYGQPGNYDVTLTATSVHGCIHTSPPVTVEVVNQPLTPEFAMDKTEGCGPLTVHFSVDAEKYLNHPYGYLAYYWSFGNGEISDRLQPEPADRTFLPPVFDTVCQVVFQVSNVCGTRIATKDIKVLSSPVARFEMMPEEGCDPLEVHFANLSTGNKNNYTWTFGDGTSSTDKEPVHTFRTGKKATPFGIELVAHNECATTYFRDTIRVKPNSLNVMFKMSDKYICAGDTVCFTNFSSDTSATILNQYWDFGDGQFSSAWDTCHRFDQPGRLEVTVRLDNGCSKASYSDTVVVYPIPKLDILCDNPVCEGDTFHFALVSDQPLKKIDWNLGDGKKANAMQVDHIYAGAGLFTAEVEAVSAEIASCPSKAAITVEAWPKPDVRILPLDTTACPPFLYRPEIISPETNYFKWDYGDGSPLTSDMEHLYTNDTNYVLDYSIKAYVETNRGCREEYKGHLKIYNGPKAAIDKDISYGRPEKVRFINLSRDYTQCFWYLPDGRFVAAPEDQELVFEEEDTYPLSLAVVNEYGCRDSLYLDYRSYQGGLYFPDAFIPHSTNPKVNRFNGIGMGLKEYRLEIFDLYGNKVWETTALSMGMPSEGWDGKNSKGQMLPQGIYIWRAKAIFFSEDVWTGKNNRSGKPQSTQGTVLMLRE